MLLELKIYTASSTSVRCIYPARNFSFNSSFRRESSMSPEHLPDSLNVAAAGWNMAFVKTYLGDDFSKEVVEDMNTPGLRRSCWKPRQKPGYEVRCTQDVLLSCFLCFVSDFAEAIRIYCIFFETTDSQTVEGREKNPRAHNVPSWSTGNKVGNPLA